MCFRKDKGTGFEWFNKGVEWFNKGVEWFDNGVGFVFI